MSLNVVCKYASWMCHYNQTTLICTNKITLDERHEFMKQKNCLNFLSFKYFMKVGYIQFVRSLPFWSFELCP